ncbi:MAG: GntR family transcriptional regulator [Streptococcaceae bacterium]|jgi:DNA-binding GntR family transcriptional regulator|nr:GntR family transcriptional regulator [Streptococcaceae bacterium]
MLKHIPKKTAESNREYIYRTLKQSIIEGYFVPDDKLSEPSIAAELNVSRTPVREALILLENENLVVIHSKQGTYVSKIDSLEISNFIFMRKSIEREVMKLACKKMTPEVAEALKEQLLAQKVFLNIKDGRTAIYLLDNAFHRIIYEAAGQYEAWKSLQRIGGAFNRLRILDFLDEDYSNRRYYEHIELLEILVENKIEEIDAFIEKHLDAVETTLPAMKRKNPEYFT